MNLQTITASLTFAILMALSSVASAFVIAEFSGSVAGIEQWDNTVTGNLAADIAADAGSPFNLGTEFVGSFSYLPGASDESPAADEGFYSNSLEDFTFSGGSLIGTTGHGEIGVWNDRPVAGAKYRDRFKIYSSVFNSPIYEINGNSWRLLAASLVLAETANTPPPPLDSDVLPLIAPDSSNWRYSRLTLTFALDGVANSGHRVIIGSGESPLIVGAGTVSSVPVPGSLALVLVGLAGLVCRLRAGRWS